MYAYGNKQSISEIEEVVFDELLKKRRLYRSIHCIGRGYDIIKQHNLKKDLFSII